MGISNACSTELSKVSNLTDVDKVVKLADILAYLTASKQGEMVGEGGGRGGGGGGQLSY